MATKNRSTNGSIVLVHWEPTEAEELAAQFRKAGWQVKTGMPKLKALKASPPTALVISLRRLPSHGREVADALWYTKWGRAIPIVFFDGEPDKVDVTRSRFPDARFTTWSKLSSVLHQLRKR
jgi:type IV secretory pathway protease TraF